MDGVTRLALRTAACLALIGFIATGPLSAAGDAEVPLYTNEDLERFPALPDSRVDTGRPSGEEWRFVVDYIQREYARIDSDRAYDLERDRTEAEIESIERGGRRTGRFLPYNFLLRAGAHRGRGSKVRGVEATFRPGGQIRPLHAGPTRAQIDHARASRRSGADAVPSRPSPRSARR